jgi:hypothetical protein
MSIDGLSAEDLAMLTPEERKGYEEDDENGGEDNGSDNNDQGDGASSNDGAGSNDDKWQGDGANKKPDDATGTGEGNDGADKSNDGNGEDETLTAPPAPLFKAELPADIAAKRTQLDTDAASLADKFDEGEITFAEYQKQQRAIDSELRSLDRAELKAELAAEAAQSQSQQTWEVVAQSFVADHPAISKNATMWNSFDSVLRGITAEIIAKGGQPGRRELEKAYKQWSEDLGITNTDAKETKQQPKTKKQIEVPPTLGKVPAATQNDTDDGKYAHLDRLADSDSIAFEAALKKMSDSERDEYLRMG